MAEQVAMRDGRCGLAALPIWEAQSPEREEKLSEG